MLSQTHDLSAVVVHNECHTCASVINTWVLQFARRFPLDQTSYKRPGAVQNLWAPLYDAPEPKPEGVEVDNPSVDYTPPSCITLLFTDLGVLTPAAISDELIKLCYDK